MNDPRITTTPARQRIYLTAGGLILMALAGFLALGDLSMLGGMNLASPVFAEQAPDEAPEAQTAADSQRNREGLFSDPDEPIETFSIFQSDPLAALSETLRLKERELKDKEAQIAQAEDRLDDLRKEIEQNLERLQGILHRMERLSEEANQRRRQEISKWVKVYEAMAPEEASPILSGLDATYAQELLSQMDSKKAAKILAFFPPEQAIEMANLLDDSER